MDLPRQPGYVPSVTGVWCNGRLSGVVGQVHLYGPKRWWVPGPLALLIPPQRVQLVFETRMVPLRKDYSVEEWELAASAVQLVAEEQAETLTGLANRSQP